MNSQELKNYIKTNSALFWDIKESEKENLSIEAVVERMLSFGSFDEIKMLFQIVGIKKVAEIFFNQISRKRVNYHPRTVNYFKLYFEKNAR